MSYPPNLCLVRLPPRTASKFINSLDSILLITRDTAIEESSVSLSLDSRSVIIQEKGMKRRGRERDWEEGKRKKRSIILLFSKFILEKLHFQVNCNASLLSLALKELP